MKGEGEGSGLGLRQGLGLGLGLGLGFGLGVGAHPMQPSSTKEGSTPPSAQPAEAPISSVVSARLWNW